MDNSTSTIYSKRLVWLSGLFALCMLSIFVRLIQLQLISSAYYYILSRNNLLRAEPIISPRGNIVDCNGTILATNRPVTTLSWQGTGNQRLTAEQLKLATYLAETKQLDVEPFLKKIRHTERRGNTVLIETDIELARLSNLLELFPDTRNLLISTKFERYYPHNQVACHILGHLNTLNKTDSIGIMGLEKIAHVDLKGAHGMRVKPITALSFIHEAVGINPLSGKTITTTLDVTLQKIVERHFPAGYRGAALLMDPQDGALKAVVSRPAFDPTLFLSPIAPQEWHDLQVGEPFLNRAFNTCYPPASPFKLIMTAAALQEGLVTPETTSICQGHYSFKGKRHFCNRRSGHGELTLQESIAKSCNIIFFDIATQLSIDTIAAYAHKFGLGEKTGINFQEKEGLIPTKEWKLKTKKERWWLGENISCAIGQSYLLVTPLQIARMIGSIFEGYLATPRICLDDPIMLKPLEINPDIRKFLRKSMAYVVRSGTGQQINVIEDVKIYAKTGTGQTCSLKRARSGLGTPAHAWFVGYIKVKGHKPIVLVIVVEHGGSASIATKAAKNILVDYKNHLMRTL